MCTDTFIHLKFNLTSDAAGFIFLHEHRKIALDRSKAYVNTNHFHFINKYVCRSLIYTPSNGEGTLGYG
jgi:hypothetical protein